MATKKPCGKTQPITDKMRDKFIAMALTYQKGGNTKLAKMFFGLARRRHKEVHTQCGKGTPTPRQAKIKKSIRSIKGRIQSATMQGLRKKRHKR